MRGKKNIYIYKYVTMIISAKNLYMHNVVAEFELSTGWVGKVPLPVHCTVST